MGTERQESGYETITEIPSIKMSLPNGRNIYLKVKTKDVREVLGVPEMSAQAARQALVAGVTRNGANRAFKENARIEEEKAQKQLEKENESPRKRIIKKYVIPIALMTAAGLFVLFGPNGLLTPHEVEHHVPIQMVVYNIDNPSIVKQGLSGEVGQEQLTANSVVYKDKNVFEGTAYQAGTHAQIENWAINDLAAFEQWKVEIDGCMNALANKNASQDEIKASVDRLLEIERAINFDFSTNEPYVEELKRRFEEVSKAARDSRTDLEIQGTDLMLEMFKAQIGLSSVNVSQLEMMQGLMENGYQVNIDEVVQDPSQNYHIEGEMIKTLMLKYPNLTPEQISVSWKNFSKVMDTTKPIVEQSMEQQDNGLDI